MAVSAILGHVQSLNLPRVVSRTSVHTRYLKHSCSLSIPRRRFPLITTIAVCPPFSLIDMNIQLLDLVPQLGHASRIRSLPQNDEAYKGYDGEHMASNEILEHENNGSSDTGNTFLIILIAALGVAAILTVISVTLGEPSAGLFSGVQCLPQTSLAALPVGYSFKAFGYLIILPEYAPGWLYFWLLMAAGCGLFISEEALNIWVCPFCWYLCSANGLSFYSISFNFWHHINVGISLSRMLSFDGTWQSFAASLSKNAPYIMSTVMWVYWGVCISDMVPFYLGKLFKHSGASFDICAKLGISEDKVLLSHALYGVMETLPVLVSE
ncbi:hypothetical protein LINPERPRIM_LOCUS25186 [Linum perenne]